MRGPHQAWPVGRPFLQQSRLGRDSVAIGATPRGPIAFGSVDRQRHEPEEQGRDNHRFGTEKEVQHVVFEALESSGASRFRRMGDDAML